MTIPDAFHHISATTPNSVWLEDGLIYFNFNHAITLESVIELTRRGAKLAHTNKLDAYVSIIYVSNAGHNFKLGLADLGRLAALPNHKQSLGVVLVGLKGKTLQFARLANRMFYANRLMFCRTLDEARVAGEELEKNAVRILEQPSDGSDNSRRRA